jgi:hypothetical protein
MNHRTARRAVRALLAAGLTAALTAIAPGAARADLKPPTPVGRHQVRSTPTLPATVSAQATAAVTCTAANGFSRVSSGQLYRLLDTDPLGGAGTMTEQAQVGSGFTGSKYAWIGSGGDGVLYALTWSGALLWYRYDVNNTRWIQGRAKVIGTGFTPRTKIINIAVGGDGWFYVVRADGRLVLYRHLGRLTGAARWADPRGLTFGRGWTANEILAPNGDGTLYRQYKGYLYWYRHTDPAHGRVTWSRGRRIGRGWKFYDLLPAGGGVLYATEGGSGVVKVYRHGDPVGGSGVWSQVHGVTKMTARPDSFGITIDPMACSTT